jgi:chromosomal replication initiator protein
MFLARELTDHSLPEIGRGIGGRNHTTVLHAVNRVGAAVRTDAAVRDAVDNLRRRLGRPAP